MWYIRLAGVRPLKLVILSRRAAPSPLILASRRSRRRRAARWAGDSSAEDMVLPLLSYPPFFILVRFVGRVAVLLS